MSYLLLDMTYKPYTKNKTNKSTNSKPKSVYSSYRDREWPAYYWGEDTAKNKPSDNINTKNTPESEPKKKDNFNILRQNIDYYLVEHRITKERKWVSRLEVLKKQMPNAFYDADYQFSPEGETKWD